MPGFIKICGLTRLEDAMTAAEAGADAVGFLFAPSPRRIDPAAAAAIIRELPAGVLPVGVFADASAAEIARVRDASGIRAAQLHGCEVLELTAELTGLEVIRVCSMATAASALEMAATVAPWAGRVRAFLLDAGQPGEGGTGRTFAWEAARMFAGYGPVIVAGGLTPDNVGAAIARARAWGVDVSSGVEISPGIKDARRVRQFIVAARRAFQEFDTPPRGLAR
ncbi:MAG: phosphoribosylanthranilate isomerase [Terriglobales bacterium]